MRVERRYHSDVLGTFLGSVRRSSEMHSDSRCHGEYNVSGGKLIAVALVVSGEQLCAVELSGDFFLDPEETLERMAAAVEGISAGTPAHELLV